MSQVSESGIKNWALANSPLSPVDVVEAMQAISADIGELPRARRSGAGTGSPRIAVAGGEGSPRHLLLPARPIPLG